MDIEKTTGYQDQEVLLRAYVQFVSKQIGRSENIVKGMIRQSIHEWTEKNNMSLREVKHQQASDIARIVDEIMDIFLSKIEHIVESKFQRQKLKENALQIYDHWKKSKRVDPSDELISEMEELVESE